MKVSCYGKGDLDSSSISRLSAIDSESNDFSSFIVKPNSSWTYIIYTGSNTDPGQRMRDNSGRNTPEVIRIMEAVFRPENFWIFSGAFRSLSCAFPPETGRKSPEKIRNFAAGILLP